MRRVFLSRRPGDSHRARTAVIAARSGGADQGRIPQRLVNRGRSPRQYALAGHGGVRVPRTEAQRRELNGRSSGKPSTPRLIGAPYRPAAGGALFRWARVHAPAPRRQLACPRPPSDAHAVGPASRPGRRLRAAVDACTRAILVAPASLMSAAATLAAWHGPARGARDARRRCPSAAGGVGGCPPRRRRARPSGWGRCRSRLAPEGDGGDGAGVAPSTSAMRTRIQWAPDVDEVRPEDRGAARGGVEALLFCVEPRRRPTRTRRRP